MSAKDITVELQERKILGKGLGQLRRDGLVPAVIHDHGKPSIHVMGDFTMLTKMFADAGKHHPVQLAIGKENHLALIKDVDFEPTKRKMRHVVFQAIKQNEKVEAEIPVQLQGEIPAERASLMVITGVDTVTVEALPKDLPDVLTISAAALADVGDKLQVSDLQMPDGVTLVSEPDAVIAHVEMPKDQIAEADAAAAALAEDKAASEAGEEDEAEATEEAAEGEETAAEGGKESGEEE